MINICKGVAENSDAFFNEWYKSQIPNFKNYDRVNIYWDLRDINSVPVNKLIMIYNALVKVDFDTAKFKCFLVINAIDYERLKALYKKNNVAIVFCNKGELPFTNKKINNKLFFNYFFTDTTNEIVDKYIKKSQVIFFKNNFIKSDIEIKVYLFKRVKIWFYDIKGSKNDLFEIILTLGNRFANSLEDLKSYYLNIKNEIVESGFFKIIEIKEESLFSEIINGFTLQFNDSEYDYLKFLVEVMDSIQNEFFETKGNLNNVHPFVKDTLLRNLAHIFIAV